MIGADEVHAIQAITAAQTMNVAHVAIQRAIAVPMIDSVRLKETVPVALTNSSMGAP